MEEILSFMQSYLPESMDIDSLLKTALFLTVGSILLGVLGRLVFGERSALNHSISSAFSILFIYAITVTIHSLGVDLAFLVSPLPFVSITGDYMSVFVFEGVHYTILCDQILSMIILAFLANLADSWLPAGKNIFSWFFFRCLSVLMAMLLHLLANAIITAFLPEGLLTWAPVVLLGMLVILMSVGLLKIIIGTILSATVSPLIGILYTFFFANIVGKQLSRAVLTTGILAGIVYLLNYFGITSVFIAASALTAYIPFLILLLLVWYVIKRLL